DSKIQNVRFQGKCLPRSRITVPNKRKDVLCRNEWRSPAGAQTPISVKMVERPKLAAVCGHYDHFYAQLDLLRKRVHGPNYHHVPQKDTRDEESYDQEESHSPPPGQWLAEYLQRKCEAQQYKLKVEKQLGLRPSSAEPNDNQRQKLRSDAEGPRFWGLQFRRNEMKEQEYWKQLEEIRQQYHHDMKEIRKKMGCDLEEDSKMNWKTYLVKKSGLPIPHEAPEEEASVQVMVIVRRCCVSQFYFFSKFQDIERDLKQIKPQNIKESKSSEQKHKAQRGLKFEINLNECISDENTLQEEEAVDILNETLTSEDGMKFMEYKCMKGQEDYTDQAFETLCCPEAELCIPDATAAQYRRQWAPGAPQTLLQMMASADVTSTCSTMPEGEADISGLNHQQEEREAPDTAVFTPN
ncbi:hypothetical protein M91_07321, partial [Bos mutus]